MLDSYNPDLEVEKLQKSTITYKFVKTTLWISDLSTTKIKLKHIQALFF